MKTPPTQYQQSGEGSTNYQAGGNINFTTIVHADRMEAMQKLVKMYYDEKEKGPNSEKSDLIKKLERLTSKIDGELLDLKQKLELGGYQNDVEWALTMKESYAMILQENKFSIACQHIHAFLLAWIIVLFNTFAYDAIKSGLSKEVVKQIIVEKVIAPVENLVGGENNVLGLYSDDINGMIYYLTGNCHLKWS